VNRTAESYGLLVATSRCLSVAPSIQPSCVLADGIIPHLPDKQINYSFKLALLFNITKYSYEASRDYFRSIHNPNKLHGIEFSLSK
jgi:hypothetical protein